MAGNLKGQLPIKAGSETAFLNVCYVHENTDIDCIAVQSNRKK